MGNKAKKTAKKKLGAALAVQKVGKIVSAVKQNVQAGVKKSVVKAKKRSSVKAVKREASMGSGKKTWQSTQVNVDGLMGSYKKNFDAMSSATSMAAEALQTIASLQTRYIKDTIEEWGGVMKQIASADPKARNAVSQKAIEAGVNRTVSHGKAIAQALSKTGTTVAGVLNKQVLKSSQNPAAKILASAGIKKSASVKKKARAS